MYTMIVEDIAQFEHKMKTKFNSNEDYSKYQLLVNNYKSILKPLTGDNQREVQIIVSIRTDRTNELFVRENELFYENRTTARHVDLDIESYMILAAKDMFDEMFEGNDYQALVPRTHFLPVGVEIIDSQVYLYVNIVVDHLAVKEGLIDMTNLKLEKLDSLIPQCALEDYLYSRLYKVEEENSNV